MLEAIRGKSDVLLRRIERVAIALRRRQAGQERPSRRSGGRWRLIGPRGSSLSRDGGNPDPALSQGETAQAEVIAALRDGDPEAGATKLTEAQASVQEAQLTIEQVQKARSFCDRDPAARTRETERLRTAMAQAESYQADLERDFAPSSWTGVARNLDQAHALFATFDRQVQDAVAVASTTRQEYLKGEPSCSRSWPVSSRSCFA